MICQIPVVVHTPVHSQVAVALTYLSPTDLPAGSLVRIPLGKREMMGVVWDRVADEALPTIDPGKLRPIAGVLEGIAPLSVAWRKLVSFAAHYYQRSLGEVALAALPPQLRDLNTLQLERRLKKHAKTANPALPTAELATFSAALTTEQTRAIERFGAEPGPFLLFGTTGSGKTEVYLRCVEQLLASTPEAQAMVMVPEINLTPQLEERFMARFGPIYGEHAVVSMHSGMTPAQRLKSWLAAHSGAARIVLGTRMAVFSSMPQLKLIIVRGARPQLQATRRRTLFSA
jgi:primosomal protein N' (replication factor Y)